MRQTRDDPVIERRTVLRGVGTLAVAGALAGCGGDGGGGGSDGLGYLSNTSNYSEVLDKTGQDEVQIMVGTRGNGANWAFSPAAIRVDQGTTVLWEWTGKGQQHNVVSNDGDFESELTAEEGHTFDYTFDETGTYLYHCTPHEAAGMKGAVVVE